MALSHTQNYTDSRHEDDIFKDAERIVTLKNRLKDVRTSVITTATEINADANADADLKTLATQATSAMNNAKITDFISFIENNLE